VKKQLPIALGMLVGLFAVAEFYIPAYAVGEIQKELLDWGLILAAAAFVLGGINVLQVNWPKIRRREVDWGYKVVLLGSAVFMGLAGVAWHTVGGERASGEIAFGQAGAAGAGQAELRFTSTDERVLIAIDGAPPMTLTEFGAAQEVPAGKAVAVKVFMPPEVKGYSVYEQNVELQAGESAHVKADLVMQWGKSGRVYLWFYDHVFDPCNSTMFALLAFFIASAAFRAFRARNTEAALLLGAAILVMIGRAPVGGYISDFFPDLASWILDIPNNAGRRAIMMGAALGGIVTGLRVILGIERSHLGSD
jgi:hypothetical protein